MQIYYKQLCKYSKYTNTKEKAVGKPAEEGMVNMHDFE